MANFHSKNDSVSWKYGSGKAQGKIDEIYKESLEKTIKGSKIKKKGTKDNPAYSIVQENGNKVIKLHSELIEHKNHNTNTHSTIDDKHFIPTAAVAKEAAKGLKLKENFNKGGTEVGHNRAKQLSNRKYVSIADVKKMYSYFARHIVDKKSKDFGNDDNPSKGYIAWLLWGGDSGKSWIDDIYKSINK